MSNRNRNRTAPATTPMPRVKPTPEKIKERKDARAATMEAQKTVARSFASLVALVSPFLWGNATPAEVDTSAAIEVIETGHAALTVGFPKLNRPAKMRGATIADLLAQRAQAYADQRAGKITDDEHASIIATIEGRKKRLEAAQKKAATATA